VKATTELKEFAQLGQAADAELNMATIYGDAKVTKTALESSPSGAFAEAEGIEFSSATNVTLRS